MTRANEFRLIRPALEVPMTAAVPVAISMAVSVTLSRRPTGGGRGFEMARGGDCRR